MLSFVSLAKKQFRALIKESWMLKGTVQIAHTTKTRKESRKISSMFASPPSSTSEAVTHEFYYTD